MQLRSRSVRPGRAPVEVRQVLTRAALTVATAGGLWLGWSLLPDAVVETEQPGSVSVALVARAEEDTTESAGGSPGKTVGGPVPKDTTEGPSDPAEEPATNTQRENAEARGLLDEPADVPADQPVEEPPAEVPAEEPATNTQRENAEARGLLDEPAEEPAEVPAEEPAGEPVEVPAEEQAEEPATNTQRENAEARGLLDDPAVGGGGDDVPRDPETGTPLVDDVPNPLVDEQIAYSEAQAAGFELARRHEALEEEELRPPEFGESVHGVLGGLGVFPGVGVGPDLADAALYATEGNFDEAGESVAAAVPLTGDVGKVRRLYEAGDLLADEPGKTVGGPVELEPTEPTEPATDTQRENAEARGPLEGPGAPRGPPAGEAAEPGGLASGETEPVPEDPGPADAVPAAPVPGADSVEPEPAADGGPPAGEVTDSDKALRDQYNDAVTGLADVEQELREQGYDDEQIARDLQQRRRDIGVEYKDLTTPEYRENVIYPRNIEKYGDPLGPTVEWLRADRDHEGQPKVPKTWSEIIESAKRTSGKDLGLKGNN